MEHSHGAYCDGERCNSVQPISTATAHRKTTEDALKIAPDRHEDPHAILLVPQVSAGRSTDASLWPVDGSGGFPLE
jgi:hypothetical protein